MKRRALLVASGGLLAATAARVLSQPQKSVRRIAFVHPGTRSGIQYLLDIFRVSLRDLGYIEGRDISIDPRWAEDRLDLLESLAAEAVAQKPVVIVTATSAAVAVFKKTTSSIPIVFATAGSPVEQGFVSTLQRPGGNITGVLLYSALVQKIVEIAREALPAARRLAILTHETDPAQKHELAGFEPAALRFKFEPLVVRIVRAEDLERAFGELAERKADAAIVPQLAIFASNQKRLIALAQKAKLPVLGAQDNFAENGGLLNYATSREENFRRAAALVDKILRGANPGDLPIEQPERFYLIVNRKTAKAIGVELSRVTMFRADRIIE
jgi:putative ABC transport system substrate-binding protein